jgi:hypothetical protein
LNRYDTGLWEVRQCLVELQGIYIRHKQDVQLKPNIWRRRQSFPEVQREYDHH